MNIVTVAPYSNLSHRDQVIALWEAVFGYESPHNSPALVIDKKLAANDGLFYVAVSGSEVIGTIMAGYDGHRGWIYSLAVSAAHRRCGVGSQLVRHAESALAKSGCVKVNLQIMEGNETVSAFYAALGFSVEKRVSMGKRLEQGDQLMRSGGF
jgi:ribosomal protein S18 acetylase RimI-like enzyme